ncbi:hypothetical protein BDN72DRAFT_834305 [Pluteus cervinus]|uniref:Uncharacterized protein n=1 Tax=Pluteus cervinus TaxID=181527 RepID=A0ACD3B805_9AGAR|nr:hypothetical protein BDN72DRAFT_834305 [Pluteus cervinus]
MTLRRRIVLIERLGLFCGSLSRRTDYIAYGSEPSMGNVYGRVSLIAKVGPLSGRGRLHL